MSLQSKLFNRKVFEFLICLVLAASIWVINKLTKEYSYDLPYKVCVHSSSTNGVEPMCATNKLYVRVTAKGFYIMQHRHQPALLDIDIKKMRPQRVTDENNETEYTLPTGNLQSAIKEAIGEGVRVESIITESLTFDSSN